MRCPGKTATRRNRRRDSAIISASTRVHGYSRGVARWPSGSVVRGFALALALWFVSAGARADVDKARAVFAEGVRLFKRGDWEGARRLFREADAEHHAPAIVYNLGLAEEKLGHPQAAVDAFEAYIAEAGEAGELSAVAAAAIAQIKARSTRLRLDTRPSGARLFVDGTPLPEPAPTTLLVSPGRHVVVAQGDGWRAERDIEATGTGDLVNLVLDGEANRAPATPAPAPAPSSTAAPTPSPPEPAPPPAPTAPEDLVWGASFAIAPVYLLGVTTPNVDNAKNGVAIVAGPTLEIGYALTPRFELLGRGFVAIGPAGKPSYAYMGGPGLSYRVGDQVWLGAAFIGGQLETRANDARYGTNIVFGGMLEASFVFLKKAGGEWMAGLQPGFLLTERRQDNTAIFVPVTFGYRAF